MKWFGESWGAPICSTADRGETPVDSLCVHCNDPIALGDRGLLLPTSAVRHVEDLLTVIILDDGPYVAYHLDCFLDSTGGAFNG